MGTFMAIYAWNNPDESECYAWPESNAAIRNPVGLEGAIDVTRQFHRWFFFGFIISMVAIMYSVFATLYTITKTSFFLGTANSFFTMAMAGNLGWTICGTVFRYKHHGKVCSGDYFNEELYSRVPPF